MSAARLPALSNLPPEPCHIFDTNSASVGKLDFTGLVKARKAHETACAANGVRKSLYQAEVSSTSDNASAKKTESVHKQIIHEMNAVLRHQQERGIGTGLERKKRWTGSASGGRSTEAIKELTGNSANAELTAGQ